MMRFLGKFYDFGIAGLLLASAFVFAKVAVNLLSDALDLN